MQHKTFLIDSFQHEQKQILRLMGECNRARLDIHNGDLAFALTVALDGLRDLKADKLSELEAFSRFHIVSRITNEVDLALTVVEIERQADLRWQAKNDLFHGWREKGWITLFDGTWELTPIGRANLLPEAVSA